MVAAAVVVAANGDDGRQKKKKVRKSGTLPYMVVLVAELSRDVNVNMWMCVQSE